MLSDFQGVFLMKFFCLFLLFFYSLAIQTGSEQAILLKNTSNIEKTLLPLFKIEKAEFIFGIVRKCKKLGLSPDPFINHSVSTLEGDVDRNVKKVVEETEQAIERLRQRYKEHKERIGQESFVLENILQDITRSAKEHLQDMKKSIAYKYDKGKLSDALLVSNKVFLYQKIVEAMHALLFRPLKLCIFKTSKIKECNDAFMDTHLRYFPVAPGI